MMLMIVFAGILWWKQQQSVLEQRVLDWLSAQSPYPLELRGLGLDLLPVPSIHVDGLSLSPGQGQGAAYAARLSFVPGFACWLGGKPCGEIEIDGLALDMGLIEFLVTAHERTGSASGLPIALERLTIRGLSLRTTSGQRLGPYEAKIDFERDGAGRAKRIIIARIDGSMNLILVRAEEGGRFRLMAQGWRWPIGPTLHFDHIDVRGHWSDDSLLAETLDVRGYGGEVHGRGQVGWSRGLSLEAKLEGRGIALAPIIETFGGHGVAGVFSGRLLLESHGEEVDDLLRDFVISGPFSIAHGRVYVAAGERPPLEIDRIDAQGHLDRSGLVLSKLDMHAYRGRLLGKAEIGWSVPWRASGTADFSGIAAEPLLACLDTSHFMSGRLSGHGRFDLRAQAFSHLLEAPSIDATVRVDDGVFSRIDLEKADEGRTPFHSLRTEVHIADGRQRYRSIEIESERLRAEGGLNIADGGELKGAFDVSLRYTGGLASVPVVIGGDLSSPLVGPAGSALIGGAIGTGVMGPGIGTVVGARVGQFLGTLLSAMDD